MRTDKLDAADREARRMVAEHNLRLGTAQVVALAGVIRRSPRWWRATWWRIRAAVRRWQWLKGGR